MELTHIIEPWINCVLFFSYDITKAMVGGGASHYREIQHITKVQWVTNAISYSLQYQPLQIATHTHVGFYGLRGLSIGVMVFILYKLYLLLPYTYPTPKLSPHRRRCISIFPQKNSLCMIYKRFKLWGHWKCPHKSPSPCNTYVIIQICVLINHINMHTHTHTHTHTREKRHQSKNCSAAQTGVDSSRSDREQLIRGGRRRVMPLLQPYHFSLLNLSDWRADRIERESVAASIFSPPYSLTATLHNLWGT